MFLCEFEPTQTYPYLSLTKYHLSAVYILQSYYLEITRLGITWEWTENRLYIPLNAGLQRSR